MKISTNGGGTNWFEWDMHSRKTRDARQKNFWDVETKTHIDQECQKSRLAKDVDTETSSRLSLIYVTVNSHGENRSVSSGHFITLHSV